MTVLVVIVCHSRQSSAVATRESFRSIGVDCRIVSTGSMATPPADLTLPNVGYGASANAAARRFRAEASWILVLNDDLDIDTDQAVAMISSLDRLDAAVGLWSFTGISTGIHPRRPGHPTECPPHGAALAIRSSIFDQVGGFDPDFFLYAEEIDLWLRLPLGTRSGFGGVEIAHLGAGSTQRGFSSGFERGRSTALLVRKHRYRWRGLLRLIWRSIGVAVIRRKVAPSIGAICGGIAGSLAPSWEPIAPRVYGAADRLTRRAVADRFTPLSGASPSGEQRTSEAHDPARTQQRNQGHGEAN